MIRVASWANAHLHGPAFASPFPMRIPSTPTSAPISAPTSAPTPAPGSGTEPSYDEPNAVDVYVGARIKTRRMFVGLSQEELGQQVGLTFQQIQKYESGKNRVSASRLYAMAQVLNVRVGYFWDGYDDYHSNGDMPPNPPVNVLETRETIELVRAYFALSREKRAALKQAILAFSTPDASDHK